jgi:sRNA-binding carbon storage regulator CsrA
MQSNLGKLVISRRSGESFYIGDLSLTVQQQTGAKAIDLLLDFPDGYKRTIHMQDQSTHDLGNSISLYMAVDSKRGNRPTIAITAPKHIKILRSELMDDEKEPVQRGRRPAVHGAISTT